MVSGTVTTNKYQIRLEMWNDSRPASSNVVSKKIVLKMA